MLNHTFVIYSLAGSILGLLFIMLVIKAAKISNPSQKSKLILLPLLLPSSIYLVYRYVINKACTTELWTGLNIPNWVYLICDFGYWAADKLVPLFVAAVIYAIGKAFIHIWYCEFLVKRYGEASEEKYQQIYQSLNELSREFQIEMPRVVIIPIIRPKAFTFGIIKPTIVISQGMLKLLDNKELKMVLAHEMSHIFRKDVIANWGSVLLKDITFFNPVSHLCFAKYQCEREKAADINTINRLKDPVGYASLLLKLWKAQKKLTIKELVLDSLNPYPGFLDNSNIIESRIRLILDHRNNSAQEKKILPYMLFISLLIAISLALVC